MRTKSPKPIRCVACKSPISIDAYYCKKCGVLVSAQLAPDAREIDKSFFTWLKRFWYLRPIAKFTWALIAIVAIASGSYFFHSIRIARIDNHSSAIFLMKVDTPYNPFQCSGPICQATVEIVNKTNTKQSLFGIPYFKLQNGKLYGPINLKQGVGRLYFADKYCTQKFNLSFAPKESKRFIGVCTENLPKVGTVVGIQIRDQNRMVVLSTDLNVSVP